MSDEYNSKLTVQLNLATEEKKIQEILEEMEDIGSPFFIYPIYEKWKKFNHKFGFISHYFISCLTSITSKDVLDIAKEIMKTSQTIKDILWVYPILEKYSCFDEIYVKLAKVFTSTILSPKMKNEISDIDLGFLLSYLSKSGRIKEVEEDLRNIVITEDADKDVRELSLHYLLRINPKIEIRYFIDNLRKLDSSILNNLLAKEILRWRHGEVSKLLDILKDFGGRPKEIIEDYEKQKQSQEKKIEEDKTNKYINLQVVHEIHEIRTKINSLANANENIKSPLFYSGEQLIFQQEVVIDQNQFLARCIELRDLFENISEITKKHSLTIDDCKALLPGQQEDHYTKPINRLFLFLYSKSIKVEIDIFGMRQLNQIVSLIGHPKQQSDLFKVLKQLRLYEIYKSEKWDLLHSEILHRYRNALSELFLVLNK
jgi:hypothetical protein